MEHNSFPLEFQLPDGKDTLQTAQNVINQTSVILQMLSAVYMVSPAHLYHE